MFLSIKLIAQTYIDAGYAVVPLVKGEKRAATSWQKKVYTPDDFKDDDGIALKCGKPSGNLIDFDLDCPEAIKAATRLLPLTGMIHGRPGKPDSHWWYICADIKTTQFTDVKDAKGQSSMLCEIRSTGGYTAVPPSGHPSGEVLAWAQQRVPLAMVAPDANDALRSVALAALIARHWPGHGATHTMVGPLAGFLCQGGIPPDLVVEIITTAAWIAGGDERDCRNYAASTVGKFKAGTPVTGGPKLAETLAPDVINKMRGWLKLADLDALEEMNAKHFWVRMGKDDVIGREDDDYVVFQKVRSLYSEYANRFVKTGEDKDGEASFRPVFQTWLEYDKRRQYRKVVFSPPPCIADPRDYNLWRGYAITPVAGDCQLFLDHLRTIICSADAASYAYLLNLVAFTIQEPGSPSEVATMLRGEPGTGKGIFIRALGRIFGPQHFAHLDKSEQLSGKFNASLSGKIIVFADEAFFAGDKRENGALKRVITEPTLWIERKGLDGVPEDNHVKLYMATNEEWSIPAMLHDRRFFALHVSSARRGDHAYFKTLEQHLDAGGLAAFIDLKLKFPVDRQLIRSVPRTAELRVQQNQTLPLELKWWQEILHDEVVFGNGWGEWVPVNLFHEAFELWGKGRGRVLDKLEFGRRMSKFITKDKPKACRFSGAVQRAVLLFTLAEARKVFDEELGTESEWPAAGGTSSHATIPF